LGRDGAGVVEAVGDGVDAFAAGDDVFGVLGGGGLHDGTIAERAPMRASGLARRPAAINVADAGVLALAGATAVRALEAAGVREGDTLLVAGATGGVGSFAVQLAAVQGVRVLATARVSDEEFVLRLGAAQAVDHTGDLERQVRSLAPGGVDAVVHLAGDPALLLPLVRDGGRFASAIGFTQEQAGGDRVTVVAVHANPTAAVLTALCEQVVDGSLRVPLERSFSLEDSAAALERFSTGKHGKIGIAIQ
jgi:NADPH:quinone reductase-like Zn-dependent oxidoreductase